MNLFKLMSNNTFFENVNYTDNYMMQNKVKKIIHTLYCSVFDLTCPHCRWDMTQLT